MISAYCVDFITIIDTTSDEWREPVSTTERNIKCYIDWKTKLVRNIKGEEVVAAATIYIPYDGLLTHAARIKIAGIEHAIINIFEGKDFSRNHYEVFVAQRQWSLYR